MIGMSLATEKGKITLKDEPLILRYSPDISGLSRHIEAIEERTVLALQTVFDFFKGLGIDPVYRLTDSNPPNRYVWASYLNKKGEQITISFCYFETPYYGVHKTLSIYKDGNKKSNIRELRKLYSD